MAEVADDVAAGIRAPVARHRDARVAVRVAAPRRAARARATVAADEPYLMTQYSMSVAHSS